ncbi:MAG TPA: cell division topological specificity factor MinE [Gemmataceae bacterium]|jgi:cell division topological specificity factor|nr:cell division topological specificity factor MinE [Gemmataceae bacterium]
MKLFEFLRRPNAPNSAQTAKDRLQLVLAHERQDRTQPDYLPLLQKDILGVIRRYVEVASDQIHVRLQRGDRMSTLEIEVELPASRAPMANSATATPSSAFAR